MFDLDQVVLVQLQEILQHYFFFFAIVNTDYEFIMVDVGKNGKMSDNGVFQMTEFYNRLMRKTLQLPTTQVTEKQMNLTFISDDAFPLHENLLKLFSHNFLLKERRVFNYKVS